MYSSSLISKIEKAKRYAEERDRISFSTFQVTVRGDNGVRNVEYNKGEWKCDCSFFSVHAVCSHTMAMERLLDGRLTKAQRATA